MTSSMMAEKVIKVGSHLSKKTYLAVPKTLCRKTKWQVILSAGHPDRSNNKNEDSLQV